MSELRLSTLDELLHKLATELLHFAQDVVTEEFKMIARAAVKNDGDGHVADSAAVKNDGDGHVADSAGFGKQPWFVSVKQDLASGNVTDSDESSCMVEETHGSDESSCTAEEAHGAFVTAEMFRAFLDEERHRPLVADLPKHIIDLRHLILQIGRQVFETHGIGIVVDQMHVIRFSNDESSRIKLGMAMTCDMRSISFTSATLDTWLRYVRPFRLAGYTTASIMALGFVLRLEATSLQLRQVERCLHTARAKHADTALPYIFSERFHARHGRGMGCCEVYHDSDRLCRYFVDMVHVACRGLLVRQPWTLPMSWSVVKSLGLRTTMLQLLPKDSCPRCWFQNRVRVSPGSIRGEPGVVACQHKVSCPRDNKKLR